jgi:hypothetical protein
MTYNIPEKIAERITDDMLFKIFMAGVFTGEETSK